MMSSAASGVEESVATSRRPCFASVPRLLGRTLLQLTWASCDRVLGVAIRLWLAAFYRSWMYYVATYVIGYYAIYRMTFTAVYDMPLLLTAIFALMNDVVFSDSHRRYGLG